MIGPQGESLTPEEFLGAHVRRILSRTAVPAHEREDVAEELYGHLWRRWQNEQKHGMAEWEAAYAAIEAFGGPEELAPGLTRAYHGRLFASTIGVLLPAAAPSPDRPAGMTRSRALLGITIALWTILLPLSIWRPTLSPLREMLTVGLEVAAYPLMILAYRALPRQQAWALRYVQVFSVVVVVGGVIALLSTPITINFLAILGLVTLPAVFSADFSRWVADSRQVGPGLAAIIVAGTVGPWFAPAAIAAMPDPSLAEPADLVMVAHMSCVRDADGSVSGGTVTVELTWGRTDLFPYGAPWAGMANTDLLEASDGETQGYGTSTQGLAPLAEPSFVDTVTGTKAAADIIMSSGNPLFQESGQLGDVPVDPATIQAGHRYAATFTFTRTSPTPATDALVRVTYDHQHRWGLVAPVSCDGFTTGWPVTTPDAAGAYWFGQ